MIIDLSALHALVDGMPDMSPVSMSCSTARVLLEIVETAVTLQHAETALQECRRTWQYGQGHGLRDARLRYDEAQARYDEALAKIHEQTGR